MSASPFDRTRHFNELNEPLDTQEGVLSPAVRKARALEALMEGAAGGTLASDDALTLEERGDGVNYVTRISADAFAFGTAANSAAAASGSLVYTFPAGVVLVKRAYIRGAVTIDHATQTDTPELGLGTTVGSGANATLGAVASGAAENIMEGQVLTNLVGTAIQTFFDEAGVAARALSIASGGDHTVYLNIADTYGAVGTAALSFTGDIVIEWMKLP